MRDYRAFKSAYYESNNRNAVEQITAVAEVEITNISRLWPYATMNINPDDTAKIEELDIVSAVEEVIDIQATDDEVYPDNKYEDIYRSDVLDGNDGFYGYEYSEQYYHTDDNSETDWALVKARIFLATDQSESAVIADRVLYTGGIYSKFRFNYGVYDATAGRFFALYDIRDALDEYPGLYEAIWELNIGRPVGDSDGDSELTILDATHIQRILAGLEEFDEYTEIIENFVNAMERPDEKVCPCGFSDTDKDGEVTVLDATRIQRKLAGLV